MQRNVIRTASRPIAWPRRPQNPTNIAKRPASSSASSQNESKKPPSASSPSEAEAKAEAKSEENSWPIRYLEAVDQDLLHQSRDNVENLRRSIVHAFDTFKREIPMKISPPSYAPDMPSYICEKHHQRRKEGFPDMMRKVDGVLGRLDWHLRDMILEQYCGPGERWRKDEKEKLYGEVDAELAGAATYEEKMQVLEDWGNQEIADREKLRRTSDMFRQNLSRLARINPEAGAKMDEAAQRRGISFTSGLTPYPRSFPGRPGGRVKPGNRVNPAVAALRSNEGEVRSQKGHSLRKQQALMKLQLKQNKG